MKVTGRKLWHWYRLSFFHQMTDKTDNRACCQEMDSEFSYKAWKKSWEIYHLNVYSYLLSLYLSCYNMLLEYIWRVCDFIIYIEAGAVFSGTYNYLLSSYGWLYPRVTFREWNSKVNCYCCTNSSQYISCYLIFFIRKINS